MSLKKLGFNHYITKINNQDYNKSNDQIARVVRVNKERYIINDGSNNYEAELTGNFRNNVLESNSFPTVGDWVEFMAYDIENAVIVKLLPRFAFIKRRSVQKESETQLIASNIDYALVMTSTDRDFNLNRLERYIHIVSDPNIEPVIILNKIDLVSDIEIQHYKKLLKDRFSEIKIFCISSINDVGLKDFIQFLQKENTYCLLGSSGVGKSTLINNLRKDKLLKTSQISSSTHKGKHTTTFRSLFQLKGGAILIDLPGMREIGVTNNLMNPGDKKSIVKLAEDCQFANCLHINEPNCAVIKAIENGELDVNEYENFIKMIKESEHFQKTLASA